MYSKQQPCSSSIFHNEKKKKKKNLWLRRWRKTVAVMSVAEHLALFYSIFPSPQSEIKINAGERGWDLVMFAAGCD